ncbi:MAG: hypothetical protein JWM36_3402 [Hyphomicrobiales bacterium]|nr:hypothetical protein [Hyphomicrobiales bacterium]
MEIQGAKAAIIIQPTFTYEGFLADGGEMGALTRAYAWSESPLGLPQSWPQVLKTTVRLLLTSRHPMFIWWGPDLIQFYNDSYASTMGPERHPKALGQHGRECWEEIWDIIGPQIVAVQSGAGATWNEQQLVPVTRHGRREDVWWTYGYSPIEEDGVVRGVLVICNDVTEEVKARERAKDASERLSEMFQQAPGFMAMLRQPEHIFEFVNNSYLELIGNPPDVIGKSVREVLPEVEGQGFFELLDDAFITGEAFEGHGLSISLQRARPGGTEQRFVDFIFQPIRDGLGSVTGIFVEGYDVTERHLAEEQQQLLLGELNHRVKNLFAIAGGMVSLSARSALTPQDMATSLRGRLDALARANDLIHPGLLGLTAQAHTDGTTFDALVRAVLLPYFDGIAQKGERVTLCGPHLLISGAAVTSLALVLHETATNAAKYGALSTENGEVEVVWVVSDGQLHVRWQETHGPEISKRPRQSGFGTQLINRTIVSQLQGTLQYDFAADGLRLEFVVALERVTV